MLTPTEEQNQFPATLANGYLFVPAFSYLYIYRFIPATPISNLSRASYLVDKLRAEGQVYSDRISRWKEPIPEVLRNQPMIMTRNDDKNSTTSALLECDIQEDGFLFVAVDERMTRKPAWLTGWDHTGLHLQTDDGQIGRALYRKRYSAGHVVLGPNRDAGMPALDQISNYSVFFVASGNSAVNWEIYR
jgi:hypothetical protein